MSESEEINLRDKFQKDLNEAIKARNKISMATLRLVLAAIKDRDISLRGQGGEELIDNKGIISMLKTMIKQRNDSIVAFNKGNRPDKSAVEAEEIKVIERYLPPQWDEAQSKECIYSALKKLEAKSVKDMGKVMTFLKQNYGDSLNMSLAGEIVREVLLKKA